LVNYQLPVTLFLAAVRIDIRWQLLLAAVSIALVLAILSFQVQAAGLCSVRVPATGGVLVEGMVGAPRRLNPLLSDGNPVDQELVSLIFDGLTRYDDTGQLQPALARRWEISDDGLTARFELREDVTWHDGRPFTAADVLFTYGLLQNDDFPAPPEVKLLWQSVTLAVEEAVDGSGPTAVLFTLPSAYGPFLDATTRGILPAHLLRTIPPALLQDHAYNQAPVGTGAFRVASGSEWRRTGRLRLAPNLAYWRQGMDLDGLEFRFYADDAALVAAFTAGEIHAINNVNSSVLPEAARLAGMRLFTAPSSRYTQLLFNLTSTGAPAVRQPAVRQAVAHALDRQALIDEALNGQALLHNGPYLPNSWAYNPGLVTGYQPDPDRAATLLAEAGWQLEGESERYRDGELLRLRLLVTNEGWRPVMAGAIIEQWQAVGITGELLIVEPDALHNSLAARDFDVALVDVDPPGDPDFYDFWSQEAIVRGQNYAGWNHRRASEALEAARQLWSIPERQPYYDAFLRFFEADLPALTLFQHVYTYGISDSVLQRDGSPAEIGRINQPLQRYRTMPTWFLFYRDVNVPCPELES
jgi:peptide/nickel transport system substrate-binding protein